MSQPEVKVRIYRFGPFELDVGTGELRRGGVLIRLQDQPLQLLETLLERPGELVTRDELRTSIWPAGTYVEFNQGLYSAVARLRDALGDTSDNAVYVQTLPRRGYRFIAPVDTNERAKTVETAETAYEPATVPASPSQRKRILVFAVALAAAGAAAAATFLTFNGSSAPIPVHSIAVLPLQNLTGSAEFEYLADGFTEELVTQLGKDPLLRVISRTSTMRYKGTTKGLREIAKELNVERIVEGSLARSGDRIRVTAQLIDAEHDQHIWAESYDRQNNDFFRLESELAAVIEHQIHAHTAPAGKPPERTNPAAYDAFLRGRYEYAKRDRPALEKSIEFFNQAIREDPAYAAAYAGLADSYIAISTVYRPPREVMPLSKQAVEKALALNDDMAEAHSSLGWILFSYEWDWAAAERHIQRAIQLNSSYAPAHSAYSGLLTHMGREKEAVVEMRIARQLDPLSLSIAFDTVWNMLDARQYDLLLQEADKTLSTDPDFGFANSVSGLSCAIQKQYPEAISRATRGAAAQDSPVELGLLGEVYARAGKRLEAERTLTQLKAAAEKQYVCHHEVAALQIALGRNEEALKSLEEAHQARSDCMPFLRVEPRMDPIRSDPRFQKLLQEIEAGR